MDAVLALQVRHAGGGVSGESDQLFGLQLVFLLPQERQEVPAYQTGSGKNNYMIKVIEIWV